MSSRASKKNNGKKKKKKLTRVDHTNTERAQHAVETSNDPRLDALSHPPAPPKSTDVPPSEAVTSDAQLDRLRFLIEGLLELGKMPLELFTSSFQRRYGEAFDPRSIWNLMSSTKNSNVELAAVLKALGFSIRAGVIEQIGSSKIHTPFAQTLGITDSSETISVLAKSRSAAAAKEREASQNIDPSPPQLAVAETRLVRQVIKTAAEAAKRTMTKSEEKAPPIQEKTSDFDMFTAAKRMAKVTESFFSLQAMAITDAKKHAEPGSKPETSSPNAPSEVEILRQQLERVLTSTPFPDCTIMLRVRHDEVDIALPEKPVNTVAEQVGAQRKKNQRIALQCHRAIIARNIPYFKTLLHFRSTSRGLSVPVDDLNSGLDEGGIEEELKGHVLSFPEEVPTICGLKLLLFAYTYVEFPCRKAEAPQPVIALGSITLQRTHELKLALGHSFKADQEPLFESIFTPDQRKSSVVYGSYEQTKAEADIRKFQHLVELYDAAAMLGMEQCSDWLLRRTADAAAKWISEVAHARTTFTVKGPLLGFLLRRCKLLLELGANAEIVKRLRTILENDVMNHFCCTQATQAETLQKFAKGLGMELVEEVLMETVRDVAPKEEMAQHQQLQELRNQRDATVGSLRHSIASAGFKQLTQEVRVLQKSMEELAKVQTQRDKHRKELMVRKKLSRGQIDGIVRTIFDYYESQEARVSHDSASDDRTSEEKAGLHRHGAVDLLMKEHFTLLRGLGKLDCARPTMQRALQLLRQHHVVVPSDILELMVLVHHADDSASAGFACATALYLNVAPELPMIHWEHGREPPTYHVANSGYENYDSNGHGYEPSDDDARYSDDDARYGGYGGADYSGYESC
eukprot:gb/GEZN01001956.1/.p1 GENE.gb/GEZN01001956.1/~~gb/GEZN01001956.1/.p1  ORF type:complete len:864 (-),score=110.02 gb/GEZN01001956.1/:133-2700(-)